MKVKKVNCFIIIILLLNIVSFFTVNGSELISKPSDNFEQEFWRADSEKIYVNNEIVYTMFEGFGRLVVHNASNPTDSQKLIISELHYSDREDITGNETYTFFANSNIVNGIVMNEIFIVNNNENASKIYHNFTLTNNFIQKIVFNQGYLYTLEYSFENHASNLLTYYIINYTNPELFLVNNNTEIIKQIPEKYGQDILGMYYRNNYLFLHGYAFNEINETRIPELQIWDYENKVSPKLIGKYQNFTGNEIQFTNDHMFVKSGNKISIYDHTNKSDLTLVKECNYTNLVSFCIRDNLIYISTSKVFSIVDITNIDDFVELGNYKEEKFGKITVENDFAYISLEVVYTTDPEQPYFYIFDVSDPSNIIKLFHKRWNRIDKFFRTIIIVLSVIGIFAVITPIALVVRVQKTDKLRNE